MRNDDNFEQSLEELGVTADESEADITIDSEQFDKGWLGSLLGFAEKDYGVPIARYTPETIFSNKVPALDANFINPRDDWSDEATSEEQAENMNNKSIALQLHETIANWYIALRNLALVLLLSILLYVGIRMVISSTAADKSKYKQMLMDWIVAICILFFLHYIMSFILTVTEIITDGIGESSEIVIAIEDSENGNFAFRSNLTGLCRLQVQYSDLGARLIYLVFYIALIVYTVIFTWIYVKRAITMAFLTLMAPLVAITYPIDKISDGQAQAFSTWIREFVFNALLQPFHLIIYTIFLGSATQIAINNPIYAILFLAFIIPAEKLLRSMFGFQKSSTAGGLGAAVAGFGGAAAFKAISGVVSRGAKLGAAHASGGKSSNIRQNKPINANQYSVSDSFGGNGGALSSGGSGAGPNSGPGGAPGGGNGGAILTAGGSSGNGGSSISSSAGGFAAGTIDGGTDPAANIPGASGGYYTPSGIWVAGSNPSTSSSSTIPTSNVAAGIPQPNANGSGAGSPQIDSNIGLGQWARNTWDNSSAKATLDSGINRVKNTRLVRTVGNGVQGVRNMAATARQGIGAVGAGIRTRAGNMASSISNGIEARAPGFQQALKNSAKGFVEKAAPVAKGVGAVGLKAGETALRTGGAVLGAGVGTVVGAGIGIAGGDLEDVLKYTAAGAALGTTGISAAGRGVARGISNTASSISDTYNEAAYGLEEAAIRQQTRTLMNDENYEKTMVETFKDINDGKNPTVAERREIMQNGTEFYNNGVTEYQDISKGLKMEKTIRENLANNGMEAQQAEELARKQAITIANMANEASAKDLRDDKYVGNLRKDIVKKLTPTGLSVAQAEQRADGIIEMVRQFKES